MTDEWTWDFFIAHAGRDSSVAETLYGLMKEKARVFLDSQCLDLGDNWDAELAKAQRASMVTVVLVSSNTEEAYYERVEIAAAIALAREAKERHRVVPVFLDARSASPRNTPYGLGLKHGIKLSDAVTFDDAARELLALLGRLRKTVNAASSGSAQQSSEPGILHQPPPEWASPVRKNPWRYKVAAFDFDGTLLRGDDFSFSWEAVWQALAFGKRIQNKLRREYRLRSNKGDASRAARIKAYQHWCDEACRYFKSRGLTREQLRSLTEPLRLTQNCRQALTALKEEGVVLAIISGGIHTFLEDTFPDYRDHFDFVFINELAFTKAGDLDGVRATPFDFEGKAEALDLVCKKVGCTPTEAIFVGDHFNDEAIMLRVDKAIAYPPQDVIVRGASHEVIDEDDLMAIVPHVLAL